MNILLARCTGDEPRWLRSAASAFEGNGPATLVMLARMGIVLSGRHVVILRRALMFLEKLAALVPPPRAHRVTYHGAVPGPRAPAAAWRSTIVPGPSTSRRRRASARCGPARRYPWAD